MAGSDGHFMLCEVKWREAINFVSQAQGALSLLQFMVVSICYAGITKHTESSYV